MDPVKISKSGLIRGNATHCADILCCDAVGMLSNRASTSTSESYAYETSTSHSITQTITFLVILQKKEFF
jgi:hypothetical protein